MIVRPKKRKKDYLFVVYIRRFIYKFLNVCPFDYTAVGRWARKPVNHTSWVAVVTQTDRPKSVRNCCLIVLFCGVVCVAALPFDISVGIGAFVIGLGQISSFLSFIHYVNKGERQKGYKTSHIQGCRLKFENYCYCMTQLRHFRNCCI